MSNSSDGKSKAELSKVKGIDKNIGKTLEGRYEIDSLIDFGGMADVYKGVDITDNKVVAIKILKPEFVESEDFIRRFRNESKAVSLLSHPNIVKIYDIGFEDEMQFIVMEYIDGVTLKEYMNIEKVLSWKDTVHFAMQILRALQHAHDKGIVHRDIKPQNIMMLEDGTIKVMDFGIAKFSRDEATTDSEQTIGSVHYISPEQARGEMTDERSDIYSMGIMLFEMLTGQKPFDSDNPVSIAVMHMNEVAEYPTQINPEIPYALEEIIFRAIEKEPEYRYQSACEMMKDLEDFKADPTVSFGYYMEDIAPNVTEIPIDSTRSFEAVVGANVLSNAAATEEPLRTPGNMPLKKQRPLPVDDYDDDDDDDDEYSHRGSTLWMTVLTSAIIVVIIVAVVLVGKMLLETLKGGGNSKKFTMPNLVNLDFTEAVNMYPDLKIIKDGEEYNELPRGYIIWQSLEYQSDVKKGDEVKVKVSRGQQTVEVPNVVEQNLLLAQRQFEALGLRTQEIKEPSNMPENQIIRTEPAAGELVPVDSVIILYISSGQSPPEFRMDNLVGKTIADAEDMCRFRELKLLPRQSVNSYEPEGIVVGQSIPEGEMTMAGKEITLQVSNGILPEGLVTYKVTLPANAAGIFDIDVVIDGGKSTARGTIISTMSNFTEIQVRYQGTNIPVVVMLTNRSNYKTATIGTYTFDFATNKITSTSENILGAFTQVEGIVEPLVMPNFVGKTRTEAETWCRNNGITATFNEVESSYDIGIITEQGIPQGTGVTKFQTAVTFSVSKGITQTQPPTQPPTQAPAPPTPQPEAGIANPFLFW